MDDGIKEEKSAQEVITDKQIKCGGCLDSTDKAEAFCYQCAEFVCKECVESHKVMKPFAHHEIDSLKKRQLKEKHKDCDNEPNITVHPGMLLEKLMILKQIATKVSNAVKNGQTIKHDAEKEDLVYKLQSAFTGLHLILDECERELIREAIRKLQDNEAVKINTTEMGVEVRCAEALQQLCLTNVNISWLTQESKTATKPGVTKMQASYSDISSSESDTENTSELTGTMVCVRPVLRAQICSQSMLDVNDPGTYSQKKIKAATDVSEKQQALTVTLGRNTSARFSEMEEATTHFMLNHQDGIQDDDDDDGDTENASELTKSMVGVRPVLKAQIRSQSMLDMNDPKTYSLTSVEVAADVEKQRARRELSRKSMSARFSETEEAMMHFMPDHQDGIQNDDDDDEEGELQIQHARPVTFKAAEIRVQSGGTAVLKLNDEFMQQFKQMG